MSNQEVIDIFRGFLIEKGKYSRGMTNQQILEKTAKILKQEFTIITKGPND